MVETTGHVEGRVFVVVKDASFGKGVLNLSVGDKWEIVEKHEATSHLPATYKIVSTKDPSRETYVGQRELDKYFYLLVDLETASCGPTLKSKNISIVIRK